MYSKFDPESTKELTNCAVKFFDSKYEKADLPQIVKDSFSHLTEYKSWAIEPAPEVLTDVWRNSQWVEKGAC